MPIGRPTLHLCCLQQSPASSDLRMIAGVKRRANVLRLPDLLNPRRRKLSVHFLEGLRTFIFERDDMIGGVILDDLRRADADHDPGAFTRLIRLSTEGAGERWYAFSDLDNCAWLEIHTLRITPAPEGRGGDGRSVFEQGHAVVVYVCSAVQGWNGRLL